MIYFIRSHRTGHIKIGFTDRGEKRLNALKSLYGEFDILGFMKGEPSFERQLHKKFKHLNVTDSNDGLEWFLETKELTIFIKKFTETEITDDMRVEFTPMELVLGECRAQILIALQTPLNTGELACELDVSPGAISQHIKTLSMAGLIESVRNGKYVYHRLTTRGQNLIDVFLK